MNALRHSVGSYGASASNAGARMGAGDPVRPLGVALLGIEQRMENMLRLFFQTCCQNRYVVAAEEAKASLSIIDLDSYQGKTLWSYHTKRYPDRPAVLLSLTEIDVGEAELVPKPLRIQVLQSAMDRVWQRILLHSQRESGASDEAPEQRPQPKNTETGESPPQRKAMKPAATRLSPPPKTADKEPISHNASIRLAAKEVHAFIGTAPDIDLEDVRQVEKAQYDPRRFLVGRVVDAFRLAEEKALPVRLTNRQGSLTLLPAGRKVLVDMQERHLRSLSALPISDEDISLSILKSEPAFEDASQASWQELDAFIWNLTLNTCRGRMPLGTDPIASVALRNWPNMTRLQLFPHALRIAALWMREPTSLRDTAKVLAIPQRCVLAFYSATHILGLAETEARAPATAPVKTQPVQKHVRRSLLSRIIGHLQFRQEPDLQHT